MNALKTISIIVPIFNEEKNIPPFFDALKEVLKKIEIAPEIIFVNDGSTDGSQKILEKIAADSKMSLATGVLITGAGYNGQNIHEDRDIHVKVIEFSRNFGKEIAITAGLNKCTGEAAIMIDADFQHPLELIPEFISKWEQGAEVVIGIRRKNKSCGWVKSWGSFLFYRILNNISGIGLVPNATDFRLLDRQVIDEFNKFTERQRMTRALIAWLGFKRDYIYFEAAARINGRASYNIRKLVSLAMNSFVSLSLVPLKWAGYLGVLIVATVGPFGLYVLIGKYLAHWAYPASFSGPAQLAFLITFLVGIVLCSLGLVALYIAHIHNEILDRPLYVIRKEKNS